MFWQGGGKKRLKELVEMRVETPKLSYDYSNFLGKNDD